MAEIQALRAWLNLEMSKFSQFCQMKKLPLAMDAEKARPLVLS